MPHEGCNEYPQRLSFLVPARPSSQKETTLDALSIDTAMAKLANSTTTTQKSVPKLI